MQSQPPNPDDFKLNDSFSQAFVINMLTAHLGRMLVGVLNPSVAEMENLNGVLSGLLASSTLITTAATQIPMANYVARHGGKKQILTVLAIALVGMAALTSLSAATDITEIDQFDVKYAVALFSGLAIGCGVGGFASLICSLQFAPDEKYKIIIQNAHGSLADLAGVLAPIVIYLLSQYGYAVPYALYTGLLTIGFGVVARYMIETPYHQARKKYPHDIAKQIAIKHHQMESEIHETLPESWSQAIKNQLEMLFNLRGLTLNGAFLATLGSYFVTETIFPALLKKGYGASQGEAVIASSLANLVAIGVRFPAGLLIHKTNNIVGMHLFGCILSIAGAIPLSLYNLPRWGLYASISTLSMGIGVGMVTSSTIIHQWKTPANAHYQPYSPHQVAIMLGLIGVIGTTGGMLLDIARGIMVDQEGPRGNKTYFDLVIAMMVVSAVMMSLTHYIITRGPQQSLFGGAMNMFQRARAAVSGSPYLFHEQAPTRLPR